MTSAIPAVIDALLTAVRTGLPGVQVIDGPAAGQDLQDRVVFIGWSQPQPSTSVTEDPATFHAATVTEQFAIPCQARSYAGDSDMAARRTAAFALVDAVETAALALAPSGVNCAAHVAVVTYTPMQTQNGTQASVDFTVTVTALD
jgi:hypothetical protein